MSCGTGAIPTAGRCGCSTTNTTKVRLAEFEKGDRFAGIDMRDPEIEFVHLARFFGLAADRATDPDNFVPMSRKDSRAECRTSST